MPIADYPVGELVGFTGRFFSDAAQTDPINPVEVILRTLSPEGTVTEYETPDNESEGVYFQEVLLDEAGTWTYRWETEDPICVVQGVVTVTGDLTEV